MSNYTLAGHKVTPAMYSAAKVVADRGGRCFVCVPDVAGLICENCGGLGHLTLQIIVGGPYDVFPDGTGGAGKIPTTATKIDGQWFKVKNGEFNCPVCNKTWQQLTGAND